MPLLQRAYEAESAKPDGVVILTVNVQNTPAAVRDFMAGGGYTFPALMDSGGSAATAYRISAIPITCLIARDGTVRYVKRGKYFSLNEINLGFERIR